MSRRELTSDEIEDVRNSKTSGVELARKIGVSKSLISMIRRRIGRFAPDAGRTCSACGLTPERRAPAAWDEPYGHRCPHGNPCRSGGRAVGTVCPKCEALPVEIHS